MMALTLWGPERLLNEASPRGESNPVVEAFKDGSYVAVWAISISSSGTDTDGGVVARLFNADGTPKGPEFLVNTTILKTQKAPQVTILSDGRFVVTWEDNSQDSTSGTQIRAQIFNADGSVFDRDGDGVKNDSDFVVNTLATGNQLTPSVSALSNGGFVIAYQSPESFDQNILAQSYDSTGKPLGVEVRVNTTTANPQREPVIAGLSGNRYIALWVDNGPADDSGALYTVRGRIMSADGSSGGTEFLVPSSRGSKQEISVAELSNGKFVVSWTHYPGFDGHGGSDGSSSSVKAQIFNADGTLYRGEFIVNTPIVNFQKGSSVTALQDGGFAVSYVDVSTGQSQVRIAIFDKEGGRSLADIYVGPPPGSTVGTKPNITTLADGRLFVAWDESGVARADDAQSIRGQIVDPRSAAVDLTGTTGNDDFYGTVYSDVLRGGDGTDQLTGDAGNDTLIGGKGADILNGGRTGVATASDGIDYASYANADAGVIASLLTPTLSNTGDAAGDTYTSIEGLIGSDHADELSGDDNANTLSGGGGNDKLYGNDGADLLKGEDGNDQLDGGLGADILQGGKGDDSYTVDNALDKVEEAAGEGYDSVTASVSYALDTLSEIEELHAQTGAANINLTGNGFTNKLYGNNGANELNGGAGADTLDGGLGNDTYVLDNVGDTVIEAAGDGTGYDTVVIATNFAAGAIYRVTDYANIEALTVLDGAGRVDLMGSAAGNKLTGNSADNVLEGLGDDDTIDGGGGVNTAVFTGNKSDYIITKNPLSGTVTVVDKVAGRDGTDTLKNIKFVKFADETVDLLQEVATVSISAHDAAKAEGDTGYVEYTFKVARSNSSGPASVNWAVTGLGVAGAANADDFDAATLSGKVDFLDGQNERYITIRVKADKDIEGHETFGVTLSSPTDAVLGAAVATGTIINDDVLPALSIAATDAARPEGNAGAYTTYNFVVTRSSGTGPSKAVWTVKGVGANAAQDEDFIALTGGSGVRGRRDDADHLGPDPNR
jgi:serralysin